MTGWKSKEQKCAVILMLLRRPALSDYWTLDGPTAGACAVKSCGGPVASSLDKLIWDLCWDIWDGTGDANFGALLSQPNLVNPKDPTTTGKARSDAAAAVLSMVGSLLIAISVGSVEWWLHAHADQHPPAPVPG